VLFTYLNFGTKPFLKVTAKYVASNSCNSIEVRGSHYTLQTAPTKKEREREREREKKRKERKEKKRKEKEIFKVNIKCNLQQFGQGV
jgi:hypothetical protein